MTVGELFAGIGGIGLGLERAGMDVKWAVEYDPYAAAVYRKNFPDVQVIEQDITTIDFTELEPVDMLAGGFPCQDISYAGKGKGIKNGTRSGLWKEYWRAIDVLRPGFVLVENVSALLDRGLGCVLGDLAAIGYNAEWNCIPAAAAGARHFRRRIFIVAYPYQHQHSKQRESRCREVSQELGRSRLRNREAQDGCWTTEPDLARMADGIPLQMDRIKCLGNAVVPQVAEFIGRRIMELTSQKDTVV